MEINNKKVNFDYLIEDTFEAGIVLTGTEIKSVRQGKANLKDSYVRIKNGELFLINTHISSYEEGNIFNHDETRERKLLMHKREILKLKSRVEQEAYTLVPLKMYLKNNKLKVLIGLAKGKKLHDKRRALKERDIERDIAKYDKY